MDAERFEQLVRRLEISAAGSPGVYRLKVLLLAALGYAYILGLLALVLALGAAVVAMLATGKGVALFVKVGWVLVALAVSIVRALWVRLAPPEGRVVQRAEAPALFERIEAIRREVGAPRPHVVLACPDLNAAVVQVPRLGVLGWQKNHLLLGVPLMRALSRPEFESVLAHEFGHLAGSHGRFGAWIYRLRASWGRLQAAFEREGGWGALLTRRFVGWYAPFFNAYSFVLARRQEYEADRAAAEAGGARAAADALLRLEVASFRMREEFWPAVQAAVRRQPGAPERVFGDLGARLEGRGAHFAREGSVASPFAAEKVRPGAQTPSDADLIAAALRAETTLADTHPCLRERLEALAQSPTPPQPLVRSAAAELLGPFAATLEAGFSRRWRESMEDGWRRGFEAAETERRRLAELEAGAALDTETEWERACLLSNEGRLEEAFDAVRRLAERTPGFAPAQRAWGLRLLGRGDEAGLAHLERALEASRDGTLETCRAAYAFLAERGREAEAQRYVERARNYQSWLERARAERARFTTKDAVEPHGLGDAQLETLRAQLAMRPEIACAYLVRKRVEEAPEAPVFVLMVRLTASWRRTRRARRKIREALSGSLHLEGDWFCLVLEEARRSWRRRLLAAAGEPIYVR